MINQKLIIAVDFDGTIAKTDYPTIIKPRKGVARALYQLRQQGHTIIINTCRVGEHVDDARNFMLRERIPWDYFNENDPRIIEAYGTDCRKISADLYIDDKNLVKLPSWDKKVKLIQKHHARLLGIKCNCYKVI